MFACWTLLERSIVGGSDPDSFRLIECQREVQVQVQVKAPTFGVAFWRYACLVLHAIQDIAIQVTLFLSPFSTRAWITLSSFQTILLLSCSPRPSCCFSALSSLRFIFCAPVRSRCSSYTSTDFQGQPSKCRNRANDSRQRRTISVRQDYRGRTAFRFAVKQFVSAWV